MVRFQRWHLIAGCSLVLMLLVSLAGQAATQQDNEVLPTFDLASIHVRPPGEQLSFETSRACACSLEDGWQP